MIHCDCNGGQDGRIMYKAYKVRLYPTKQQTDNRHGEVVRPRRLVYNPQGSFVEVSTNSL